MIKPAIGARPGLPIAARPYRRIGPFDAGNLPQGLLRTHNLKPGSWGLLELHEGTMAFVWEDEAGGTEHLVAPAQLVVPPLVRHHLRPSGPFVLSISFLRADADGASADCRG